MIRAGMRYIVKLEPQRALGHLGWLRGAAGAALGIALAGILNLLIFGTGDSAFPLLVAPLGASAVLVFAIPASPLAQPWSLIGGNLLSSTTGLMIGMAVADPVAAPALAVGIAIALMSAARCLHPPGGACALLCAMGAAGTGGWGMEYLLPISLNVLALAAGAWLYNALTGHPWPRVQPPLPVSTRPAHHHPRFTRGDIEAVLAEWDELLDIDVDDLSALFDAVDRQAARRTARRTKGATHHRARR